MRSAELSDVTAKGTAASGNRVAALRNRLTALPFGSFARRLQDASPVSLGVGLTALFAAGAFTGYELIHNATEAQALAQLLPGRDLRQFGDGAWANGLVAFALAILVVALTYRRRTGEREGISRHFVEEVLRALPFGVALWGEDGALTACNTYYLDRLRNGGPEGAARSYEDALRRLTEGSVVTVMGDGDNRRLMELHRDDDSCLLIDERPLPRGGFMTLVTDITDRKRADMLLTAIREEQRQLARRYHEEKLKAEAASRAKTSFLAHLSHDIRTPLNHIIGFAELIRQQTFGTVGDPRYLSYVEMIKGSGEKLLASFAEILDLAELESGNRPLRETAFAADALLVTVTQRFSAQANRAGLALALGSPCHAILKADRFCLERMLGNLIENAIRFTPSGGRITLAAYAADDGIVLEVSDTGIGMTAEQLGRLSQPFVFGDAAFTREHEGAGLGIAISRAIAELSAGHLAIDSSPALGTTVAISLPLTRPQESIAHAA